MKTIALPTGKTVPALGLGTWRMGEVARRRGAEVAAVRLAIEMGYRLFDTAEMYGEGGAEEVLGLALAQALRERAVKRDEVYIVSKVYPHNASRKGTLAACERSLERLGIDQIDLYLLHWRGQFALGETVAAFESLRSQGRIGAWGVSNFDTADMMELSAVPGGAGCASNQVYYSLSRRGVEFDLLPWQRERSMPLMAYCPIDRGQLARDPTLAAIGQRHKASATQVALAWLLAQPGVIAVPKAVRETHLRDNLAAAELILTAQDHVELDRRFPPPRRKTALAIT